MYQTVPGSQQQGSEGLTFANGLRDCLASGVILIDARKKVSAVAGEAEQILGLSAGALHGQSISGLPGPLQEIIRQTLSSGQPVADHEIELTVEHRGPLTLRLSAVRIRPGRIDSGVALLLSDLSATHELEQNLRRLDRLASIGTLSASMAHEIKNALVAGKTFIDLLLEKHQDSELAEVVRREMGRIDAIVTRILKFAGASRPAFAAVGMHEILEHSLRLVEPQLEAKSISLHRSFEAARDLVEGDDYELQQALVNLFLNALEAMAPQGVLTVATQLVASDDDFRSLHHAAGHTQLVVTIQDTGAGIAEGDLARLFEPFFTTKPSGTGLGLPITQRIIQEHRGAITVASALGQGTTFSLVFPALEKGP